MQKLSPETSSIYYLRLKKNRDLALILAIENNHKTVVEYLLSITTYPEKKISNIFQKATRSGNLKLVKALLEFAPGSNWPKNLSTAFMELKKN